MGTATAICAHCSSSAHLFCACTSPETLLCTKSCYDTHCQLHPGSQHSPLSFDQLKYHKIPHYYDKLQVRQRNFPRIKQEIRKNVQEIDTAIQLFTKEIDIIRTELTNYAEKVVTELKDMKEKLWWESERALEEVQNTLPEHEPTLKTRYGALIRKLTSISTSSPLFSFTLQTSPFVPNSLVSLSTHLASLQDSILATVIRNDAVLYDIETEQVTSHPLPVYFRMGGSYVRMDRDHLLCVGAWQPSAGVYDLDLITLELDAWPSLNTARCAPGVYQVGSSIYVFGGFTTHGTHLTTCEKMHLADKQWSLLRSQMAYPRCGFTPCEYHSLLYLVSSTNRAVETFDPKTDTFALLQVQLPEGLETNRFSVAFIVGGELCLLNISKQIARWKVDREAEFRLGRTETSSNSTQQPWVLGSKVLIACAGKVQQFSLVTYSFLK